MSRTKLTTTSDLKAAVSTINPRPATATEKATFHNTVAKKVDAKTELAAAEKTLDMLCGEDNVRCSLKDLKAKKQESAKKPKVVVAKSKTKEVKPETKEVKPETKEIPVDKKGRKLRGAVLRSYLKKQEKIANKEPEKVVNKEPEKVEKQKRAYRKRTSTENKASEKENKKHLDAVRTHDYLGGILASYSASIQKAYAAIAEVASNLLNIGNAAICTCTVVNNGEASSLDPEVVKSYNSSFSNIHNEACGLAEHLLLAKPMQLPEVIDSWHFNALVTNSIKSKLLSIIKPKE